MSDDPATPAEAAPPVRPPKPSKIVPLLLLLNLGASGAGTFMLVRHKDASAAVAAPPPAEEHGPGPVVPLDAFVVNLNESGNSRYLKATFELELTSAKVTEDLEKGKRIVRDEILRYLSGLSVADTLGTQNKDKIQQEIVARVDKQLGGGKVKRMFFIDFVVQ
jgi:flagellar FliL protein